MTAENGSVTNNNSKQKQKRQNKRLICAAEDESQMPSGADKETKSN